MIKEKKYKLDILHENDCFFVINKPAGLMVHSDGRTKETTLADILVDKYPETKEVGEPWESSTGETMYRPGIVHRLDRDTTGVLLITRDQKTFLYFKKQFKERNIKKTYCAFVYGNIKEEKGIIDKPIGKNRKDFRKWSAQPGARGMLRDATTEYKVLIHAKNAQNFSYVELFPKTGRTHQLRVHMKAIHHPIVCDNLYAPNQVCALGFSRPALHAKLIEFLDPDGKKVKVEAPIPKDFKNALVLLKN
ncbi:RluA family pseudouridine synthase [Patescibacteria group bacterium]|nr:RluA family pseudouridine synthase [Patescibacteria group bacterium]MBU1246951.1 RluA family pseudouridine synthase [Patescibacteria group bacterium]MBU1519735.1 RluA family pseudouridine synthase [Patescibacteria group bacterium]MBU1956113.1 RluA family pseudouridine synthase [Patescibacteria group bacterium]